MCKLPQKLLTCIYIFDSYKLTLKSERNAILIWTAIIQAHNICGQQRKAVQLFYDMQQTGVPINDHNFKFILGVISDLATVQDDQRIHAQILVNTLNLF